MTFALPQAKNQCQFNIRININSVHYPRLHKAIDAVAKLSGLTPQLNISKNNYIN